VKRQWHLEVNNSYLMYIAPVCC